MADVGALRVTLGLNSIDFTNGMKQANTRLAALNSEFKAITTGAAKFDNSLETLRSRADVLTRTMQVHRSKVEELRRQYEDSKRTKGEDAEETVKLATAYNKAVAAMNNTEQQLNNVNRRIDEQTDSFKQLEGEVNTSIDSINRQMRVLESGFAAATAGIGNFGEATEDLRQQEQHLSKAMELQQRQVDELQRLYEESARAKGKDAAETQEIAIKLNQATQAMRATERQLNNTTEEIEQQSNAWNTLSRRMDETGAVLQERGAALQGAGQGMFTAATLPLMGFAVAAGKVANDFDSSAGQIQAQLGFTAKEAEKLNGTVTTLWKQGFGENLDEMREAIVKAQQNMGVFSWASQSELEDIGKSVILLKNQFGSDFAQSTKTVNQLMTTFGVTSEEAFDILTKGFQSGMDFSGEYLDTLNEYAPQFSAMGMSAEEMFGVLQQGAVNGAFNLDKVGDAVKEFNIRIKDGSKTTSDGFAQMSKGTQKLWNDFKQGKAVGKDVMQAVIKELSGMEDKVKANQIGVAVFGTQWEDLEAPTVAAMANISDNIEGLEGATKKASNAISSNFGVRLRSVWRDFQADLKPVGDNLLKIAEDVLPKVADTLEDVTDAFADMSPEGQKTVLVLGGIVAAAGPVMIGVGALTSGFGLLTKGLAPLITSLGSGAGLAGSLAFLTNPITLTIAGLGLATAAVFAVKDATEKAKEVNFEHAKSLIEQQQSLEGLTTRYEQLRDKNKLSNEELLLFRDIQDDLKTAGTAQEVEALAKQADTLREKSGLSNDELLEMLGLNDQLIEKVPTASRVFSDQGNAVLKNADDLNKANEALREQIRLELEVQKTKAEAKLDKNIQDQVRAIEEYVAKYKEMEEAQAAVAEKELQLEALRKEYQAAKESGQTRIATALENEILLLESQVTRQNQNVEAVAAEVQEKQKAVEKSQEQIEKVQQIYAELINLQLAQAGINATGAEGIAQLDEAIAKTQTRINDLNLIKEKHGSLNAEQQKELETLTSALGIYTSTKGEIQNIQGEQAAVNEKIDQATGKAQDLTEELGKDVDKDVNVDDKGKAKKITDEAGKGASKDVNVTDQGKASSIHAEAEKAASKGITLFLENTIMSLLPPSVSIPVKLIGKLTGMFAKGTKSAPGGLSLVGEEGPELIHLPKGAKVIPNKDTETILRNWNIPMMATGGIALTDGMAYVGERGRELLDMSGAVTSPLPNGTAVSSSHGNTYDVKVYSQQVVMDENELSRTLQRLEALYG